MNWILLPKMLNLLLVLSIALFPVTVFSGEYVQAEKKVTESYQLWPATKSPPKKPLDRETVKKIFIKAYTSQFKNDDLVSAERNYIRILGEKYILADYVHFFLSKIFLEKFNYKAAALTLEQMLVKFPKSRLRQKAMLCLGDLYYMDGKEGKALRIYKDILNEYPAPKELPRIIYQTSDIYQRQEKWQKAVDGYKELLITYPESTFSFLGKEKIREIKNKVDIKFDIKEEEFYSRAILLGNSRFYAFGVAEIEIFIQKFPNSPLLPSALFNIGRIYERRKSREKAVEAYQGVFQRFPESTVALKALYRLGRVAWNINWDKQVINVYSQILEMYKDKAKNREEIGIIGKVYFVLGRIYEKKGDLEKASYYYKKITEVVPSGTELNRSLWKTGWIHYSKGEKGLAKNFFYRLGKKKDYWGLKGRYWAGRAALEEGEIGEAKALFLSVWNDIPLSYYGTLSYKQLKNMGILPPEPVMGQERDIKLDFMPDITNNNDYLVFVKALELFSCGLKREGTAELRRFSKLVKSPEFHLLEGRLLSKAERNLLAIRAISKIGNPFLKGSEKKLSLSELKFIFPLKYKKYIWEECKKNNISPWVVAATIRQESVFNPLSVSHANAYGLMQIIPPTGMAMAAKLNFEDFSTQKLFDPKSNIMMGTKYLGGLIDKYSGSLILALAHYNAGPVAKKWFNKGKTTDGEIFIENIPYKETRNYIKLIARNYFSYIKIYKAKYDFFPMDLPDKLV